MRWIVAVAIVLAGCSAPVDQGVPYEEATIRVVVPGAGPADHVVAFHPDEFPAAVYYVHLQASHPGHFTVHDLLEQYRQAGGSYGHRATGAGISLTAVDGRAGVSTLGEESHWTIHVGGSAASMLSAVGPGDVVTVTYAKTTFATGTATVTVRIDTFEDERSVAFRVDSAPSAPLYAGRDVAHPGYFTVHDLMERAEEGGLTYRTGYFANLGFYVRSILGISEEFAPDFSYGAYWQLWLNGAQAQEGMSTAAVHPGDEVTWVYTVFGEEPDVEGELAFDEDDGTLTVTDTGEWASWDGIFAFAAPGLDEERADEVSVYLNGILVGTDEIEGVTVHDPLGPMAAGDELSFCGKAEALPGTFVALGDWDTADDEEAEALYQAFLDLPMC